MGNATATATASSAGGPAIANAAATGGASFSSSAPANATSTAETERGALAQALLTALDLSGGEGTPSTAQSTAKTSFAGVSVQSIAVAFADSGMTATTNAVAQGGS